MKRTLLLEARALIESGEERLICFAIDRAIRLRCAQGQEYDDLLRTRDVLRAQIYTSLSGHATLGAWVLAELGFDLWDIEDLPQPYRTICTKASAGQQMRLAWIDRMLEDLQ